MPPNQEHRSLLFVVVVVCLILWGALQGQIPAWTHRGVSEGGAPQKLEDFVFLKLESCNFVNTFGANLEQAMSKKKKKTFYGSD